MGSSDIGYTVRGENAFDKATKTYEITGGGAQMWGTADAFHFAWQDVDGNDWFIQAEVAMPSDAHQPTEKAALMFRQSLDPDSAYAAVIVEADGRVALQWRLKQGAATADKAAPQSSAKTVRLERRGDLFIASAAGDDGQLHEFASQKLSIDDPVYLGLAVCAHDAAGVATVKFRNLKIDRTGQGPPE
jgi:TolB protein